MSDVVSAPRAPLAPDLLDPRRLAAAAYVVLLVACTAVSIGWLGVGAVVAVARYWPGALPALAESAAAGSAWGRGVLEAAPRSEPLDQLVLDYAFSGLNLALAAVLVATGGRSWPLRLLAIAMVGSAGAFNLQAHAAATAVETATGLGLGQLHQVVLHGVACAAYILALLAFPAVPRYGLSGAGPARPALAVAAVGTLAVVGLGTALLPHTISCILFFGFLVPVVGLAVLPGRIRRGATPGQRTQARLLFTVLAAAFAAVVVLAAVTLVLSQLGQPGLTLHDPTAAGGPTGAEPTALLFWFSRLASAAIPAAVLVAVRGSRPWASEQLFSQGLAATLVVALAGGGFVIVRALPGTPSGMGALAAAALAAAPVALVYLPLYLGVERLVDRLLYGARPTPYSVLAGVAALSRTAASDAPDLARVAEAVAGGLGATTCRLTVRRPGLRDRTFAWSAEDAEEAGDDLVTMAIRYGGEQVGEIAVDRGAVAGLDAGREHLLEDIADSLGVVLQASRAGIELERQLRAAMAHAEEIALARRRAVAEMDSERRRIERDLHDGAQHHLVSLRATLGLVEYKVRTGALGAARERLDKLITQIGAAETVLAETATGVSAAGLAERGLVAALAAALSEAHPPVTLDLDGVAPGRRFPDDIATAAYFCCLEAVNNARKHAPGVPVTVSIAQQDGRLCVAVRDEGPGFASGPPAGAAAAPGPVAAGGRGMRNLTNRITAAGGTIRVSSAPGAGTTVAWSLPLPDEPAAIVDAAPDAPAGPADRPGTGERATLRDQVRVVLRDVAAAYRDSGRAAEIDDIAARLDAGEDDDVRAARTALTALEALVRSDPAEGRRAQGLRYRLERVRSGAHELSEVDAVDRLRDAELPLPAEERRSAEQLLGACGSGTRARLGLSADADAEQVRQAAAQALARWQRRAAHPASTRAVRELARTVVQTCEQLLVQGEPGPAPDPARADHGAWVQAAGQPTSAQR